MKKNVLVISDGNGVNNNFLKWTGLLLLLCGKNIAVNNKSVIGASNELIMMQVAEAVSNDVVDAAIIQWTVPCRIDLVATEFWKDQARVDPVYHSNFALSNDTEYWVTSASDNELIKSYHTKYIQKSQAVQRSQSYMLTTSALLQSKNIPFAFTLAYDFNFVKPFDEFLSQLSWAWHKPNSGLNEFRHVSEFASYDKNLVQPHSLIQLEWIDKVLKPAIDFIDYDQKVYYNIQNHLLKNNV
jgi:hypothetical protein